MNIFEKMLAITSDMKPVEKSLNVGNKYHAVGEQDVLPYVRVLENKYKVYSYPANQEIISDEIYTTTSKSGDDVRNRFLRVKVTYRFVNVEKPEEYLEVIAFGDGLDTADKAPGKAFTYATKTALMKAYKMNSGEDPDLEASPDPTEEAQKVVPKLIKPVSKELHIETNFEAPRAISVSPEAVVDKNTGEVIEIDWSDWASKLEIDLDRLKKVYQVDEITSDVLEKAVRQKASALTNKTPVGKVDESVLKKAVYNLKKKTVDSKGKKEQ